MPFPAVNPALGRALDARAYAEPTAVQLAVLEGPAAGRDMLVSAQTGSGKTVAFGLALSGTLLGDAERFERAAEPLALIIAPTRELAIQVQRELAWLYAETGARIASCVGGMDPRAERDALGAGAHIVVGTPGRLRDHLERGRLVLTKLRAAVLDEADEMLDLGFRDDLQFILDATPAERQTLMFSATVPREIESLARRYQRDAIRIETAIRNQQHDDIEYRAVRTVPNAIEPTVVNLLRYYDAPATLVFCATRQGVRKLHEGLVRRGFSAVALSGELSQAERTEALDQLRNGRAKVLVATDVAARGLDLAELTLVIHADLPNDRETMLHRSGRTGRAGRKGISIIVVPPNKRRRAEELLGRSRINAAWANAPTPREIATRDQERLLAMPILDELAAADDLAIGRLLLDGRTAEQVAAALVRMVRNTLPVPEALKDLGRPGASERPASPRPGQQNRADRADRPAYERARPVRSERAETAPPVAPRSEISPEGPAPEHARPEHKEQVYREHVRREQAREPHEVRQDAAQASGDAPVRDEAPAHRRRDRQSDHPRDERPPPRLRPNEHGRESRDDMVRFGLNIGRDKNADARWLLPMICRVGEVTKREVGTIKVGETESVFEIRAEHADNFANAVRISKNKEGRIWRIDDEAAVARPPESRRARPHGATKPPSGSETRVRPRQHERTDKRPDHSHSPARSDHDGRAERGPGHAPKTFKPAGRKPYEGTRKPGWKGETAGGNTPLKRSWKDKEKRRS